MVLDISFKNLPSSWALENYTREKCQRLSKYFAENTSIHLTWNFNIDNLTKVAHCRFVGDTMDFFAEGATEDFLASVELALDRIERQIRRHKEIVKDHLHRGARRAAI